MILHPHGDGFVAIRQSAHALVSFRLADHWGNRATPRPAPRPDVLAAVLLHDSGWDGRDDEPCLAPDGRPVAFDTIPEDEHVAIWVSCVERAGVRGRYPAYLVSHHVSHLAETYAREPHREFLAAEKERRQGLRRQLAEDPRYRQLFATSADDTNRALVRLADALAVHLMVGATGRTAIPGLPQRDGAVPLELREVGERTYRVRPWPLMGRRLEVHTEGLLLAQRRFPDQAALARAWSEAPTLRLTWTLLAPGTPADG
jgi:hypothetical protein